MVLDLIWVADTARIVVGFTLQKGRWHPKETINPQRSQCLAKDSSFRIAVKFAIGNANAKNTEIIGSNGL